MTWNVQRQLCICKWMHRPRCIAVGNWKERGKCVKIVSVCVIELSQRVDGCCCCWKNWRVKFLLFKIKMTAQHPLTSKIGRCVTKFVIAFNGSVLFYCFFFTSAWRFICCILLNVHSTCTLTLSRAMNELRVRMTPLMRFISKQKWNYYYVMLTSRQQFANTKSTIFNLQLRWFLASKILTATKKKTAHTEKLMIILNDCDAPRWKACNLVVSACGTNWFH